jgi:hypothetical protein
MRVGFKIHISWSIVLHLQEAGDCITANEAIDIYISCWYNYILIMKY